MQRCGSTRGPASDRPAGAGGGTAGRWGRWGRPQPGGPKRRCVGSPGAVLGHHPRWLRCHGAEGGEGRGGKVNAGGGGRGEARRRRRRGRSRRSGRPRAGGGRGCVRGSHGRSCPPRQPPSPPRCAGCRKPPRRRFCCQGLREERRSPPPPPPSPLQPALRPRGSAPGRPARPAHEGAPRPPPPPARGGAALRRGRRCHRHLCGKRAAWSPPGGHHGGECG